MRVVVQDKVSGAVVVSSDAPLQHGGVRVLVEGQVTLQLSARSIGLFEAFSSALKPLPLLHVEIDVNAGSKLPKGSTALPFEFTLRPAAGQQLFDTYHGVYVNVQYILHATLTRGMMQRPLTKQKEILIETRPAPHTAAVASPPSSDAASSSFSPPAPSLAPLLKGPLTFQVSPSSLQNVKESSKRKIPDFLFTGHLLSTDCHIDRPFEGELTIVRTAVDIRSIELQLVRVESCSYMEGEAREATEIQNIQVAEGNVMRGVALPLYMVFPRLFCCCTTVAKAFRVEFEVNLIVLFADQHMVTENFPIRLYRT